MNKIIPVMNAAVDKNTHSATNALFVDRYATLSLSLGGRGSTTPLASFSFSFHSTESSVDAKDVLLADAGIFP
jgi:hypothetical protein